MNGLVDLRPGADDFRLQHGDALVQLLDRQRVKVLTLEIVQRVLPSARGELVEIDRKSTRRTPVTNAHIVCRLLLEKKKTHHITIELASIEDTKPEYIR